MYVHFTSYREMMDQDLNLNLMLRRRGMMKRLRNFFCLMIRIVPLEGKAMKMLNWKSLKKPWLPGEEGSLNLVRIPIS